MKTSTKLLSMFSAFCALLFMGMTANAQSVTVVPGLTATQMAQALVGSNVTVTNATYTGSTNASGSFNQASSTFPLSDGIILTTGNAMNALGPNNSTGSSASNGTPGDSDLGALIPGIQTFDAAVLEFDITSNCNTVTFDYIFASEEYPEYGCSNFNDAFGFLISGPGFAPNTNIALIPGTTTPVSINNVINSPGTNCVANPAYYVDNAGGVSVQYDGYTVVMTATATIQPCQTYHVKIVVGDAGDSALDSAIFLKGGGINCASPSLATTAIITDLACGALGAIDLSVNSGTGPFTYAWTGPNGFTATTEDLTGLAAGSYTVDIVGSDCLSSGQATFTVGETLDVTPPVFTNCPSDLVIDAANNSCGFSVNVLSNVTATDDCAVASITTSHDSTHVFSVGTTPVTVTATDGAGNSSTCTFNVVVNAQPLVVTLSPFQYNGGVNIRCFGQNSGRVTAGASGGCSPYTFTWSSGFPIPSGPPNTSTCVALFAGTVTCTVTDAEGTSVTEVVTLVENPPVVSTTTWTPIQCFGGTSTVTVSAQAGTAPYNGLTVDSLPAGTYEYVLADANGCRAYDTLTIGQPDILDASAVPDEILCFGDSTTINVSATGGTTPYIGAGPVQAVAGTYSFDIIDANGCTDNVQLAVNQPGELTLSIANTPILCYGGQSLVSVSAASATEPYFGTGNSLEYAGWHTYTVTDENGCSDTIGTLVTQPSQMVSTVTATPILCNGDSTTITVTGAGGTGAWTGTGTFIQPAGTYGYSFNDANGCTDTNSITVTQPAPLVASATATTIACNGGTADVTITATGGTAPLTGLGTFSVTAGTHDFDVVDANGCMTTVSITVTEPTGLVASATATSIDCNGGTADITVSATGGTAPYTGPGTYTVTAGTHVFTVTDANGCTSDVTITVTEPTALVASATATSILCNGGTADIAVSATGGTASYAGVGTFTVTAGTYDYVVTDANGCTDTVSITVTEPAVLTATATATSIDCNGGTADVTVTAAGGTPSYSGVGTYTVTVGTYDYVVTDANGCSDTVSITVTEPSALVATATATSIDCNGGSADVTVTATGGTPSYTGVGTFSVTAGTYTYTVTDDNGCTSDVTITVTEPAAVVASASATSIDCSGGTADVTVAATGGSGSYTGTGTFTVTAGTYTYTVTDGNGCTSDVTITVTEPTALVASATATSIDCNGGSADVTVTATGGSPSYTGVGTFSVTAGTHVFTVTDANGCTSDVTITVTEPAALVASSTATSILCNGGTADVTVTATGGSTPYFGTGSFTGLTAGTYSYTVTDNNGCTATTSVTITEPAALVATATVGSLDCASLTSDVTIVATGGTGPYVGTGTITQGVGTTTYTVTDANGCTVSVDAVVEYENFVDLTCPGNQTFACNYSQSCGSQNTGSIVSWDEPTASSFNTCDNGCGPNTAIAGFIYMGEYNGSRYYCSNTSNYSWQAANTAAINAGGHLATIQSAGENQFISSQIMANVAWIGLTDENVEGTFEWSNGENVGYTNWGGYEPNNNGPVPNNCTYCGEADYTVVSSSQGGWYDRYECNLNEFVMEVPCGNPITITQTSGPANGSFMTGGTSQVVTYVATDDVTGATATCSFTVNVEKCTPTYCESEGYCTAYEWIDQVALGSINNQSGNDNGYADYTTFAAGASVGDVINLTLTPGFSGQSYTEAWRVWIDWNYDGDFYDQGEMVYQGYGNSAVSGSFTVPSYATVNEDLRVRVSMRWNCYPGPCSTYQYGEVEDYTIYIIDNGGIEGMQTVVGEAGRGSETNAGAQDNVKSYEDVVEDTEIGGIGLEIGDIYPNPVLAANGEFNVEVRVGHKSDVTVRIVDLSGKVIMTELMHLETGANKRTMDVTGFARGSYLIEVISGELKETTQLIVQ